jgi:hypothetical protein
VFNIITDWSERTNFADFVFRSCAKLSYADAQEIIEGRNLPAKVEVGNNKDAAQVEKDIKALNVSPRPRLPFLLVRLY